MKIIQFLFLKPKLFRKQIPRLNYCAMKFYCSLKIYDFHKKPFLCPECSQRACNPSELNSNRDIKKNRQNQRAEQKVPVSPAN